MRRSILILLAAAIALAGCAGTQSGGAPQGCSFTGKWSTNWGEMDLVQSGPSVTGNYTFDEGRINGTVSGGTMSGWWSENASENAYQPPENAGDAIFNMSSDCNNLSGVWRYGSEGEFAGGWVASRMK